MGAMAAYRDIARRLCDALQLGVPPVAIALRQEVPAELKPNASAAPPSGCVFWQRATGQTLVTSPRDHRFCTIGMYTHNLEMTPAEQADFKDTLEFFAGLGYLGAEELAEIPTLKERPHYVVYAPLEVTPIPPDVVLLYVQPGQALILAESCQAADRGAVPVIGRPACALVPMVRNSGRAAASLGCCGARSYVDLLAPGIAIWALAGPRLDEYTDHIESQCRAHSKLVRFHQLRRQDIEAGRRPTVKSSLGRLGS